MKKLLLVAAGLACGLALSEIVLQIYSRIVPRRHDVLVRARAPNALRDPRLGVRPNPDYPDHDENGFRNAEIPSQAFLVAMGDSHTYGTGVSREENWPHELARRIGRTVYGISCGGWSPTQSLLLLDTALSLHPRVIVEAFYDGNDLFDSFETVYGDDQLTELATTDRAAAEAIRTAEARDPLQERYEKLSARLFGGGEVGPAERQRGGAFRQFLREHSKLFALAAIARTALTRALEPHGWESEKQEARSGPDRALFQIFERGSVRTIFTPIMRSAAMDLDDPRFAEGLRIAEEALTRMRDRARASGVDFLVVILPTKELVFEEIAGGSLPGRDYAWVIEKETAMRRRMFETLGDRGIPYVDPLAALKKSLSEGAQPYPETADGHPNATGHRVIAAQVADALARRGVLGAGAPR